MNTYLDRFHFNSNFLTQFHLTFILTYINTAGYPISHSIYCVQTTSFRPHKNANDILYCQNDGSPCPPQPSERVRVEIVSLGLRPDSRAASDSSVVRLFVEYSLLDLPSEETPMSLPKPLPGKSSHYNYSKSKGRPGQTRQRKHTQKTNHTPMNAQEDCYPM